MRYRTAAKAAAGATVVIPARMSADGGFPVAMVPKGYPDPIVGDDPLLRGLSVSDLHWRTAADAWLVRPSDALKDLAGGQIGVETVGTGRIVYLQLDPDRYNTDEKTYFRYTRWRQTRARTQVLANLGVEMEQDARIFHPAAPERSLVSLEVPWNVKVTTRAQPTGSLIPDPGLSPAAEQAVKLPAAAPLDASWSSHTPPGMWEGYGGAFAELDGEVLYRTVVDIPPHLAGQPLRVNLGPIDDFDQTFWDGAPIGKVDINVPQFYAVKREYKLTAEQTTAGKHVLAVRIWDHLGGGGFNSVEPGTMAIRALPKPGGGFYHPDYRTDHELGDDPARYKRW